MHLKIVFLFVPKQIQLHSYDAFHFYFLCVTYPEIRVSMERGFLLPF